MRGTCVLYTASAHPQHRCFAQTWIEDMAAFLVMHDPNHLRSIGQEGFFGVGAREVNANPAVWARYTGQDFYANHMAAGITHAAVHVWPANWAILGGASGLAVWPRYASCLTDEARTDSRPPRSPLGSSPAG